MMIFLVLAIVAVLGAARAITVLEAARIEAAHPASGRLVEVEGGKLHVLELGASSDQLPIVLVHGASGNLEDLRLALGGRLAAKRRVILVDRPGHGWSDRPGGVADASPARQAALIAEALGRIGVERFVLLGHSLGGAVASALALAFPARVAGLVLLAPVTHPWESGIDWYNVVLSTPVIGHLFAHTIALPLSSLSSSRKLSGSAIVWANRCPITGVERTTLYQSMPLSQGCVTGASRTSPATRAGKASARADATAPPSEWPRSTKRSTPMRPSASAINAACRAGEASATPPGRSLQPCPGRSTRMTRRFTASRSPRARRKPWRLPLAPCTSTIGSWS